MSAMPDSSADVQLVQPQPATAPPRDEGVQLQSCGYLLELTLDWIVRRASENVHHFLGVSHVTLIDEPLGRFVHAQALHDLRNLFSRLSGTTGIARAYRVCLTDERAYFDIAFQLVDGRVLIEAVPSEDSWVGQALGTVGGLAAGLDGLDGQPLLDAAARRMRALTGYDRVTLGWAGRRSESSRGNFAGPARPLGGLPAIISNCDPPSVAIFPREPRTGSAAAALLRAPAANALAGLREQQVGAILRIPFTVAAEKGEFRADSRTARPPSFELHAAAELFAQMFAMRAEMAGAGKAP